MSSNGKIASQMIYKADGDVFYELWKRNPREIPSLTPVTIQNVSPEGGETGTVGSLLLWNYFHDGKDRIAKTMIIDIDEGNRSVTYKILEGDLMELYTTFNVQLHVESDGLNNIVTWTLEYEKLTPDVLDPNTLMDLYRKATKDIETYTLRE